MPGRNAVGSAEPGPAAREHFEDTGEAYVIPAVGDGDVAMPLAEAFDDYGTSRGAVPNYVNPMKKGTVPFFMGLVLPVSVSQCEPVMEAGPSGARR